MSLYFLLAALQADAPLDPPPIKVRPVVAAPGQPAPTPAPNPTTIYRPAPVQPASPAANPTIIYAPAAKQAPPPEPAAPERERAPIGLSPESLERIVAARKANADRQAANRQALEQNQRAIDQVLVAEPLNLDALKAALAERDRLNAEYRAQLTASVVAMLNAVPVGERLAVARAVIKGEAPKRTETKPAPTPPPAAGR
ncbi:periplasmic heavy metal sensor [Sphingomonas mesophila]|uniref:periplasmic heavy metal sensor n=1 Tax=Sphingomonas mesophila TaxID=2303576 RepID=UPI000E58F8A0|nr:periplasmic heavy metal sensor [Sphingomonas mesophila]